MGKQSRRKKPTQTPEIAPQGNEPNPETLQADPAPEIETKAIPGRKTMVLRLPQPLWDRVSRSADSAGVSVNSFVCMALWLHA